MLIVLTAVTLFLFTLDEYTTISRIRATAMLYELSRRVSSGIEYKKYNLKNSSQAIWNSRRRPMPITHCKNNAVAKTRYAIISMLSADSMRMYTVSATKLAISVRWWLTIEQLDMIMMTVEGFKIESQLDFDRAELETAGWNIICEVPMIKHPHPPEESRFHDTAMYSKLNMWAFTEYEAILFLDSDTLVIRDPTPLFTVHLPVMLRNGYTLAAVRDRPAILSDFFNAGVILLTPGKNSYGEQTDVQTLINSITSVPHKTDQAEQGMLNALWGPDRFYVLPYIFNANLVSKRVEPEIWDPYEDKIIILHYTVAKGWQSTRFWRENEFGTHFRCWWWNIDEFCQLWENVNEWHEPNVLESRTHVAKTLKKNK
jgi:lipopolysaccharide biosynthesis glycosyltransferase